MQLCTSRRASGRYAMIPVCVDPQTGERAAIVRPPPGFVPVTTQHAGQQQATFGLPLFFRRLLCLNDATEPAPSLRASTASTPTGVRRIDFDASDDDQGADHSLMQQRLKLSSAAIESLHTELELKDITDWLLDFEAAMGRVDADAHALLKAEDWRALVTQFTWAVNANKRIASALDESLIKTAPGVILLKLNLREA